MINTEITPFIPPKEPINKEKCAAVTGHRNLKYGVDKEKLSNTLENLIKSGINTFLIGMARGFDTYCFYVLYDLKKRYDIKIIACVPCADQAAKFNETDKELYRHFLSVADDKVLISELYSSACMHKRNRFMVDNCKVLLAYLRENKGGTYSTVNYAKEKNVGIIYV